MGRTLRWRGLKSLVHDAVDATTFLIEEGHESVARTTVRVAGGVPGVGEAARAVDGMRRAVTSGVFGAVRAVNRGVAGATDAGLDALGLPDDVDGGVALRSDAMGTGAWVEDALLGAVNGVVGDHLADRRNGLDLGLNLRVDGDRGPRVVVLVHGLATTEWSWCLETERHLGEAGAHFGSLLRRDLGFTPVFARYNTGRRVPDNGRRLALALEELVADWPGGVEELVLVGHSMGGLVARVATAVADQERLAWRGRLTRVACLGSPHVGAPLARFGHAAEVALGAVDLPGTRIVSAIVGRRSIGIRDLRDGAAEAPLLDDVAYTFVAGSVTSDPARAGFVGDGLVPVASAEAPASARQHRVSTARFGGVLHHELQVNAGVYEHLRRFCAGELDG